MDPTLQYSLRALLEHRRRTLKETLCDLLASSKPVELDQTVQGRLSRMDAISQQQMAHASSVHLRQECTRIDATLARMDDGRYGDCCRCAEPMDVERLKADPCATFCLDCLEEVAEERREQGRRR